MKTIEEINKANINKIKSWRLSQSEAITRHRRPDLWQKYKKD